ncbi:MAG TPA: hypothetical protein VHX20_08765 [Terracidiphilus sp.]|nr:hypothetical protein [Terracidiphilus sp.]
MQIEANAGVVFRNLKTEAGSLSFMIDTVRPVSIIIHEFGPEPASVIIENLAARLSVAKDGSTKVTIPAGIHSFSGVWKQLAARNANN